MARNNSILYLRMMDKTYMDNLIDGKRKEEARERYLKGKEEYASSYQGQINQACRDIVQETSRKEDELNRQYAEAVKVLADKIVVQAKQFLNVEEREQNDVSYEEIENYLRYAYLAFDKVQRMCKNPQYLSVLKGNTLAEYEVLFKRLVDEVNLKFVFFAPDKVVARTGGSVSYVKMEPELREKLYNKMEEMGLNNDPKFKESHKRSFGMFWKQDNTQENEASID